MTEKVAIKVPSNKLLAKLSARGETLEEYFVPALFKLSRLLYYYI